MAATLLEESTENNSISAGDATKNLIKHLFIQLARKSKKYDKAHSDLEKCRHAVKCLIRTISNSKRKINQTNKPLSREQQNSASEHTEDTKMVMSIIGRSLDVVRNASVVELNTTMNNTTNIQQLVNSKLRSFTPEVLEEMARKLRNSSLVRRDDDSMTRESADSYSSVGHKIKDLHERITKLQKHISRTKYSECSSENMIGRSEYSEHIDEESSYSNPVAVLPLTEHNIRLMNALRGS